MNNYLVWQTVRSLTSCLAKAFRDAYKGLRKALLGSEGGEEPWRYCVTDTNNVMGFAIGAMFVREVFHGNSKPMVCICWNAVFAWLFCVNTFAFFFAIENYEYKFKFVEISQELTNDRTWSTLVYSSSLYGYIIGTNLIELSRYLRIIFFFFLLFVLLCPSPFEIRRWANFKLFNCFNIKLSFFLTVPLEVNVVTQ